MNTNNPHGEPPHNPLSIVFDIETIPQPENVLLESMPPFDEADVKLGNLKDPALIKAKLEGAREKHKSDYIAKAALSPVTGEVAAIGFSFVPHDPRTPVEEQGHATPLYIRGDLYRVDPNDPTINGPQTEAELLEAFWDLWRHFFQRERCSWIGHNILDFDLPFLVNRSRILGIAIPFGVLDHHRGRVYFSSRFVDTRTHWLLGRKATETPSSLDLVSRAFGLGGKSGSGADFARLLKEQPDQAIAYLVQDLTLTKTVALRMGLIA